MTYLKYLTLGDWLAALFFVIFLTLLLLWR